jgi:hypothetical protein
MPKLPDEDWNDWISAFMIHLPRNTSDLTDDNQAIHQAKQLLTAIDQGGIPTDPIRINNIGRALGLEVLASAPMTETINRIRDMVNKT